MSRGRLRRLPVVSGIARRYTRRRVGQAGAAGLRPSLSLDPAAPELLLSPHWDDAVLSCWGLLTDARELNVVNLFAGIPPAGEAGTWETVLGVADQAQRARLRMAEDERALASAGRAAINLPLLGASHLRGVARAGTVTRLDRALSAAVASASRVYAPAAIGANRDHQLTRRYARMLLSAGMPVVLYADVPYCLLQGWPPWVDGSESPSRGDVDALWLSYLASVPEMPPLRCAVVERLDDARARAKCEAVQMYEASLSYGFRRMLADPGMHRFEVRWGLQQP